MKKILLVLIAVFGVYLTSSAQSCDIHNMWVEHNVYQSGYVGMKIHIEFTVDDCQGKTIQCCAYFYDSYGNAILAPYSYPGNFKTRDGQLCTGSNSYVKYDSSYWEDYVLFIPNGAFAPGSYQFVVQVSTVNGILLGLSDTEYFTMSR